MSDELLADGATDEQLLARIAARDATALSVLFRRRQPDVYRVAMLMTGSAAAAEDVTQDVFLAVMHDASRFESGRASVTAWLCGIARNHARRRLDCDRRMRPLPDQSEPLPGEAAIEADPLREMSNAEQIERLRRAVLTLPVRYREAVVLCDLQELSYADAATALECSIGTVRSRLHRGRQLLTAKMHAHDEAQAVTAAKRISRCLA
ncbi:MAG TPA: RNA polymerase sigma factor [Vicinamibacterales bacterium]|nr:RNA polymerase sigma factor [Vicinamibacterales bacterium]